MRYILGWFAVCAAIGALPGLAFGPWWAALGAVIGLGCGVGAFVVFMSHIDFG